jgi:hypothetical protein
MNVFLHPKKEDYVIQTITTTPMEKFPATPDV